VLHAGEFVKLLGLLVLIAFLCACEQPPQALLADARQDLASAAYADAVSATAAGLAAAPDAVTAWGLELVKLEALARGGRGEEAKGQLEKLAGLHPERIPATEYAATAHQLRLAGQGPAAIEVLDLGTKRYPEDALIARMIGDASAASSPAELELLRSLGYVE
jgi:predicted Zn-dependent protease